MTSFSEDAFSGFAFSPISFSIGGVTIPLEANEIIGELYDITELWNGVELTSTLVSFTFNPKNVIRVKRNDNTIRVKRKSNMITVR